MKKKRRHCIKFQPENDSCPICHKVFSSMTHTHHSPVQDHCHKYNRFRDVICMACNAGLGMFRDDPATLRRAAVYIIKWERKHMKPTSFGAAISQARLSEIKAFQTGMAAQERVQLRLFAQ